MHAPSNSDPLDSRAVSPVIGVILMLAITVTLAALVGTFVMGAAQQSLQASPSATISVADADANYKDGDGDTPSNFIVLTHSGGDDVMLGDTRILVRNTETHAVVDSWSGGWKKDNFNGISTDGGVFTTGETIVLTADDTTIPDDSEYEVVVVDTPTGSIVSSATVTVN